MSCFYLRCWLGWATLLWLATFVSAAAENGPAHLGPGAAIESLPVGKVTFTGVRIRSVTPRTLTFLHAGGLSSVQLRDLSPEWQARFRYDPAAEASAEAALKEASAKALERRRLEAKARKAQPTHADSRFEQLLHEFGKPPEFRDVDLRPQFHTLGLEVKDQGRRPSCAVFAVVSALEFQNASLTGTPEKFSEEYLIWATRKALGQSLGGVKTVLPSATADDYVDEGYTLKEVVGALRTYGVVAQSRMGYRKGAGITEDPPEEILTEARTRRRVFIHSVPGRDPQTVIANLVHALNAGTPIAIGIRWPHEHTARSGYLHGQKGVPEYGHAVTVVGYKNSTGRIEDTVFIYKNSWGITWGIGGYGHVTHTYLAENLLDAVLLEVESAKS